MWVLCYVRIYAGRPGTLGLVGNEEVNRFELGESYCGLTWQRVADCLHCQELAKLPPRAGGMKVVEVDHATGTVTLSDEEPEE
jgi:hypothetical protein